MAISDYYAHLRTRLGPSLVLIPSVAAIIRDTSGRILFQRKTDHTWSLPAGAIEPGENPAQAIVREVREEVGLDVRPERVIGVFGGVDFRYQYPNGDEVEYTVILFECSPKSKLQQFDTEETERVEYFTSNDAPALALGYPPWIFAAKGTSDSYFQPA
jgi:8-oxo-dGTP pyrophosphatase MutT (NUDIX family)